jgi:CheY-like chemotaxis protein
MFEQARDRVKLVLTDIMMPNMDGPTTIRSLRKIDRSLPIIAASGMADKARILELEAMGVDAFLTKPFTANELLEILYKVLQSRRKRPGEN